MSDWSSGYVVDIPYTIGYYREMSPTWMDLCMTVSGHSTVLDQKRASGEPLRYLELAIGQGLSLNIHGATHQGEFWGNDFNPTHALFGQSYAKASKANVKISHDSFKELSKIKDLPNFDVIALHGVWSWISTEDMQDVINIMYDKLNSGGVVYVSYNTNPGWSKTAPLRHLMGIHSRLNDADSNNSVTKIKAGLNFAKELAESGAAYFQQSPQAAERLKAMLQENENYLPHEYLNANWHLLNFEQAHEQFTQAKLTFASSADLSALYDSIALSPQAKQLLTNANNVVMRETIHDYMHNTMFRKDIWVKGSMRLTPKQRSDKLRNTLFTLTVHPTQVPKSMNFQSSQFTFQEKIYDPVVEFMATNNYSPKTPDEVLKALPSHNIDQVVEALLILSGIGAVNPSRTKAEIEATLATSRNYNDHVLANCRDVTGVSFMASPVIGCGVAVGRFQQMFILASNQGAKTPEDCAKKAWEWLQESNERLVKEGKALDTAEENIAELTTQAEDFFKMRLPILQALKVA